MFILLTITAFSQTPSNVNFGARGDKVIIHSEDTVSIWGNLVNEDSAGIEPNGSIVFYGQTWTNEPNSNLDVRGSLQMINPRPAPYSAVFEQEINNSGATSSYPFLIIDNPNNVKLSDNTVVREALIFKNGKLILDGNNLTIENTATNGIQGYDEDHYVVTGSGTTGGYLIREGVTSTTLDFPIGTSVSSYTPASISNSGTTDNFSVRVFDGVFRDGVSGINESAQSVDKTWDIQEETIGGSIATISLQHNNSDEGINFDNTKSFVTHYIGTAPNTAGDTNSLTKWDLVFSSNLVAGSSTGTITTGSAIAGASVTTRSGFTSFSPFTKSGYNNSAPLPVDLVEFDVVKIENRAQVSWQTATEVNNDYFELYRMLEGETEFTKIHEQAGAGNSNQLIEYYYNDDIENINARKIFYRLKQVDFDGQYSWSDVRHIETTTNDDQITISAFPNPADSEVNIKIKGYDGEFQYNLRDLVGNVVLSGTGYNLQKVDVSTISRGVYFLEAHKNRDLFSQNISNQNLKIIIQ